MLSRISPTRPTPLSCKIDIKIHFIHMNQASSPPSSWYSRRPIVVLPTTPRRTDGAEDTEEFEDSLDRHVDDVLKRPSKVRRTFMGVWSFLKTRKGTPILRSSFELKPLSSDGCAYPLHYAHSFFNHISRSSLESMVSW